MSVEKEEMIYKLMDSILPDTYATAYLRVGFLSVDENGKVNWKPIKQEELYAPEIGKIKQDNQ